MAEKVEIEIVAVDNASDAIKDVSGAVGGLDGALGEVVTGGLREFGANLLPMVGGLVQGATDALWGFAEAAMESETVQVRLNAKLQAMGDTTKITAQNVNDIATELSNLSGFDDEALTSATTTLLNFTGSLPLDVFERAATLATDLARYTGMDLNTAFQQLGRVVQDPAAGLGRLAIKLGDLSPAQQEMIAALIESGDVLGAQTAMLDAIEGKIGGVAAAYGQTAAGQIDTLNVAIGNLQENVGAALLPTLVEMIPIITDWATQLATFVGSDQFQQWLQTVINYVTTGLLPAMQQFGDWLTNSAIPAFSNLTSDVGGFLDALDRIKGIFDVLWALNPMSWAASLGQAFGQAMRDLGAAIDNGLVQGIKDNGQKIIEAITGVVNNAIAWARALLGMNSPSKVFADIGKNIMLGMSVGIQDASYAPVQALTGATSALVASAPSGGGGGIVINYAPMMSLASRDEFEQNLVPIIEGVNRRMRR